MGKFAVGFDLDDTLYPEKAYAMSGFDAVARFLGERSDVTASEMRAFLRREFDQGIRGDNFDRLLDQFDVDVPVNDLVDRYRRHYPDIELSDDADRCLTEVTDRDLAVITDGPAISQRRKFSALDISIHVDHVFISGEFGPDGGKPATDMFEAFLKATDRAPEKAVYIGDNARKDFVAPNELGMRSIWIRRSWGEHRGERPERPSQEPTAIVESLTRVPELIRTWEQEP